MAVEVRNLLQRQLDHKLPSTLIFDYPTVEKISAYLVQLLGLENPPEAVHPHQNETEPEASISTEALLDMLESALHEWRAR